jgi:hypothetical protein
MRTVILCCVFVATAYGVVSDSLVYVQSAVVSPDGTTITAVVKVRTKGTYVVVGGYVIDKDAKFQFYKGGLSKKKAYEEKVLRGEVGDSVEIVFKVVPPPPVVKAMPRVRIYLPKEPIPTSD